MAIVSYHNALQDMEVFGVESVGAGLFLKFSAPCLSSLRVPSNVHSLRQLL
jgi:hypothetical protein